MTYRYWLTREAGQYIIHRETIVIARTNVSDFDGDDNTAFANAQEMVAILNRDDDRMNGFHHVMSLRWYIENTANLVE